MKIAVAVLFFCMPVIILTAYEAYTGLEKTYNQDMRDSYGGRQNRGYVEYQSRESPPDDALDDGAGEVWPLDSDSEEIVPDAGDDAGANTLKAELEEYYGALKDAPEIRALGGELKELYRIMKGDPTLDGLKSDLRRMYSTK